MSNKLTTRISSIVLGAAHEETQDKSDGVCLMPAQEEVEYLFSFTGRHPSETVNLVNLGISQYVHISLTRGQGSYTIMIRYGKVGVKCRRPIISRYASREEAASYVNTKVQDKIARGYITDTATRGTTTLYKRRDKVETN